MMTVVCQSICRFYHTIDEKQKVLIPTSDIYFILAALIFILFTFYMLYSSSFMSPLNFATTVSVTTFVTRENERWPCT
jgi:ABC-type xylose transport system permease subunit